MTMADSKLSFTVETSCPTEKVEGIWRLENLPALLMYTAKTQRAHDQPEPSEIASCNFEMKCKCVGHPVKFKVDLTCTNDLQDVHLRIRLLEWKSFENVPRWMGTFSLAVLKNEMQIWESQDSGEMLNFLTDRNIYYQLPVEYLKANLNAEKCLTLHLKVSHAPCPASGIKTFMKAGTATAPQELSNTTQLASQSLQSGAATKPLDIFDLWKAKTQLTRDLHGLQNDEKLHDFTLYANKGGLTPFKCHKAILAARSPVFKKILSEDSIENRTGHAIMSISPQSMEEFLSFVYTGAFIQSYSFDEDDFWIPWMPEITEVAVKYEVKDLVEFCDDNLHLAVKPSNALVLRERANRWNLKKAEAKIAEIMKTYQGYHDERKREERSADEPSDE